jgi:hypothetical protein
MLRYDPRNAPGICPELAGAVIIRRGRSQSKKTTPTWAIRFIGWFSSLLYASAI